MILCQVFVTAQNPDDTGLLKSVIVFSCSLVQSLFMPSTMFCVVCEKNPSLLR